MAAAMRLALVALVILACPSFTAGQPSPQDLQTAVIAGQVVDVGSGRPVSSAFVVLGGGPPPPRVGSSPPPTRPRLLTDGEGRFAFRAIAAGTYNLSVSKPGYVDGAYGRKRPEGMTQPLKIAAGERVNDVSIPIWRQASVSGTVVDEAGEPVVGVEVRALRRMLVWGRWQFTSSMAGGFRQWLTDDRGAYRLPGLTPGDYVVVVVSTVASAPASAVQGYRDALQSGGNSADLFTPIFETGSSGAMPGTANAMAARDSVLSLQRMITPRPAGERVFVYPTTYYPAAFSASDGTIVKLGSGEERAAVDFQLHPVPTSRVAGIATSAEGAAAGVVVTLSVSTGVADTETLAGTLTDAKGLFVFPAVPVGQYTLRILKQPPDPGASRTTSIIQMGSGMAFGTTIGGPSGRPELATAPVLWATIPISVGRTDISNLAVMLQNGPRVTGSIEFEGTAERPKSLNSTTIGLEGETPRPTSAALAIRPVAPWAIRVQDTGEFASASVPGGRYFIRLVTPPPGWSFKSATLNDREVTEQPFDLQSDTAGVVITLTDTPIELNGLARTAAGAPDADARVLVFPTDAQKWSTPAPGMRRFRAARADKDGAFKVVGLPAGSYYAVAIPEASVATDWMDPKYLETLVRLATDVRLDDRDKRTLDLTTKEVR